jgi:hypothetical protein
VQPATWGKRLYFPSEGRHAEDFFHPKNPTPSAGSEPAILGTRGQRPPVTTEVAMKVIIIVDIVNITISKFCDEQILILNF